MKRLVSSPENLVSFIQKEMTLSCSGKFLRRVLEANLCRVNGKIERFGSTKLQRGDQVELAPNWQELLAPKEPVFRTLYEDDSCLIVDKPDGWVCQDRTNLFLVHRLDKDTTGALLFAKSRVKRDELMQLFAERLVEKQYLALVDGLPKQKNGVCDSLLSKKKTYQGQAIWGSAAKGARAITHWKVLAYGKQASLIECEPVTGRTHQIRVHLSEMNHPILIDRQYSERFRVSLFIKRPLLHARRLKLLYQGKEIVASAPVPEDMKSVMRSLVPETDTFI